MPAPDTQAGENEEARQLYTAGRYYSTRRTAEGLRQAIERLERAVELDSGICYRARRACRLLRVVELVRRTATARARGNARKNPLCVLLRPIRTCLRPMRHLDL